MTSSKLAVSSVGQSKLKPGAVTAQALADESVDMPALTAGLRRALLQPRTSVAGPQGKTGERGTTGPQGPRGPGAYRVHYFKEASSSPPTDTVTELPGFALTAKCEATGSGTQLNLAVTTAEAASGIETISVDNGGGSPSFGESKTANLQIDLPEGTTTLGGPSTESGQYARVIAHLIFVTDARTLDFTIGLVLDGTAQTCAIDGTGVTAA